MATAARVRAADVHACFRTAGECRDLGADAAAWQTRLAERARAILGAQVVIVGNTLHLARGKRPVSLSTLRVGWDDDNARRAWTEYADSVPLERTPEYARIVATASPTLILRRADVWDATSWYRSTTFNERHRRSGIDDYILSIVAVPGLDLFHSVWVHRALGERAFDRRACETLSLLHAEVGGLIGGALASACEPDLRLLSPRQRDTLDALLTGRSEKEIAAHLAISTTTTHEYIAGVYRHFGVRSRPELMARFVGRAAPTPPATPSDQRERTAPLSRHHGVRPGTPPTPNPPPPPGARS